MSVAAHDWRARAEAAEARVAGLELELAAWRDHDRRQGLTDAQLNAEHHVAAVVRRVFPRCGHAPQVARLLILLVARPGHVFNHERIAVVISQRGLEELGTLKVVDVTVCHARKVLRAAGLDGALKTVWGQGYYLDPARAEEVAETLGLPVAA